MTDLPGYRPTARSCLLLAAVFAAVYGSAAVLRHHSLNSRLFDLGLQHQVVWNTSQGRWFESSLEVANYLGDHVSLIVLPVAAVYRLLPRVETLLLLGALALTGSAVCLYFLARQVGGGAAAAWCVALSFLLHPACGLQSINDFHVEVLSLPFMFAGVLFAVRRQWWWASLPLTVALAAKEDVGLTLAAFGAYCWIRMRARVFGAGWMIAGLAWSLVALFVILPHFRGDAPSDTWRRYHWLLSPDATTAALVGLYSLRGALMLFVPLALYPLRSFEFLVGIFVFGYCYVSAESIWMANPGFQSLVPAIPFVFFSLIRGLGRSGSAKPLSRHCYLVAAGCLLLAATELLIRWKSSETVGWSWFRAVLFLAAGLALALIGRRLAGGQLLVATSVVGFLAFNPVTYAMFPSRTTMLHRRVPINRADLRAAAELIPPEASVAASSTLGPHLSARRILYRLTYADECQYVVFSSQDTREDSPWLIERFAAGLLADLGFDKCFDRNSLQVWRKQSHFVTPDTPTYHTLNAPRTVTDLGMALAEKGDMQRAVRYYDAVLQLRRNDRWSLTRLARVLGQAGSADRAMQVYQELLRVDPDSAEAHNNLANLLGSLGRHAEAQAHYESALRLSPEFAEAHANLGVALAMQNRLREAIAAYRRAISLDPSVIAAHQNLSVALIQVRRFGEAVAALREGLRRDAGNFIMANSLAWLLATSPEAADRNGAEAVEIATRLCQVTQSRNPTLLNTLAAAYAEAGRLEEAVQTATRALQLASDQGNGKLAGRIAELLKLYRAGRAYHQPP